jgi:hypothetical protein
LERPFLTAQICRSVRVTRRSGSGNLSGWLPGNEVEWPCLLGGSLRPLGGAVSFIDAPFTDVLAAVLEVREGRRFDVSPSAPFPQCVWALDPMEAPWTKELVIDCDGWSTYLNNGISGGDLTAIAPAVAQRHGWQCISAEHMPRFGPGHAATQLWIQGPSGTPPLGYVRTISAYAEDGRWSWRESGSIQSFEQIERYTVRRKRDRLDRPLLVEYLKALRIHVDDARFFGSGVVVTQRVDWPIRTESVEQFRQANGW